MRSFFAGELVSVNANHDWFVTDFNKFDWQRHHYIVAGHDQCGETNGEYANPSRMNEGRKRRSLCSRPRVLNFPHGNSDHSFLSTLRPLPTWAGFFWVAGLVLVIFVAWFLLSRSSSAK